MDISEINKISNTIEESLKIYPNIKFDISVIKNEVYEFTLSVNCVKFDKIKNIENRNLRLSITYGFTQNIIGMEFEDIKRGGKSLMHKIVGFKQSNTKYPIITIEPISGQSYKFNAKYVRERLGGNSNINRRLNIKKLLDE